MRNSEGGLQKWSVSFSAGALFGDPKAAPEGYGAKAKGTGISARERPFGEPGMVLVCRGIV
jgi:hypothetical protein